ncbi:nucleotidyltransferase family protein [Humitalea sp. 24SJ18S-53]|uniref:nucleotidyltransferase family protein n=1 Tax=Humitalea sp. 24SJ18S-53 TaxID=3422307 RepID=UPI003D664427
MVLAAGLGERMRPLTATTPKPLLTLAGRSLLDHALDRVADAGIGQAVVNAHWLADQIVAACATRKTPAVTVVREAARLETGGGVLAALPRLGDGPFAVINGDAYWLDGPTPALTRLAAGFDPDSMDVLLLLVRSATVDGEVGYGDFMLDPFGRPRRPKEREICPYIFSGVQVLAPNAFRDAPEGPFSLNRVYDTAIAAGRCFAQVHDGVWFHLSTPDDLTRIESVLAGGLPGRIF